MRQQAHEPSNIGQERKKRNKVSVSNLFSKQNFSGLEMGDDAEQLEIKTWQKMEQYLVRLVGQKTI